MFTRYSSKTLLCAALLLAVFALSAPTFQYAIPNPQSAIAAAPAPDPNSPFGVDGVMRWPDWGSFNQPADAMLQTGGSWVREDFVWGLIEPKENTWDWTATDRIVSTLRDRHINVLGILSYSANWATPSTDDDKSASPVSFYPPDSGKYYAFVRTLVSRYKDTVR